MRLTSPIGLGVRALLSAGVAGAVLVASAAVVAVSGAALLLAVPALVAPDGWLERGLLWGVAVSAVLVLPAFAIVVGYLVRYERRLLLEGTAPVTAIDAEEPRALDDDATRFATQFGVPKPQIRLHPASAPFAYTTSRPNDPLLGVRQTGEPVIVISKGLARTLPRDETAAVLAHEFAHLANDDLRLTSWLLVPLVAAEFLHDGRETPTDRREPLERLADRRSSCPTTDLRKHARSTNAVSVLPTLGSDDAPGGLRSTHPSLETRLEALRSPSRERRSA
ncbi:M48 family metalloprotease [Natronococcus sp. A-GB1]|uniref:M48 family metalloprotease n=1 Tax=Natronococcus sp. A-GB1 TaxID=3037648 RepID=UPI00241BF590|nr:M48 family metalloprotease [Natronococcus sp. A-GB1]MDG5760934.1 M48 family metalloprotease [Natronococcus sp. A-GB1]